MQSSTIPRHNVNVLPMISNGYCGTVATSQNVYVSGVYNGRGTEDPSHRARCPSFISILPGAQLLGTARDLRTTAFLLRYAVNGSVVEMRSYAHRTRRNLLILDMRLVCGSYWEPFPLIANFGETTSSDFTVFTNQPGFWDAQTRVAEYPDDPLTNVSAVYSVAPSVIASLPRLFVMSVASSRSDSDQVSAAKNAYAAALHAGIDGLWDEHVAAWDDFWDSKGIVTDNVMLAQLLNASLSSLLSELRWDWPVGGLSVGGVATSSVYHGHIFSDAESWMGPALQVFSPELVQTILRYRLALREGALQKAQSYRGKGYRGTMFPWESAACGNETCPISAATGTYEQHISGDIGVAVRRFYYWTRNMTWLQDEGLPLLEGIAEFWASRVECDSQFTRCDINGVISMDERTFNVSNDAYTNAAAIVSLDFYLEALALLNRTTVGSNAALVARYRQIARAIPVLVNGTNGIHWAWQNYNGSFGGLPVIMLKYPLDFPMSTSTRFADVRYYANDIRATYKYAPTGMAQAMCTVALLEVGEVFQALAMFEKIAEDFTAPYLTPVELPADLGYGQQNFITSCGGFLQSIIFGFLSLRVDATSLRVSSSALLPPNTKYLHLRGVSYLQSRLDLLFDLSRICVVLKSQGPYQLFLDGSPLSIEIRNCVVWGVNITVHPAALLDSI